MEENKTIVKLNSVTYGVCIFVTSLILAVACLITSAFRLPHKDGIGFLVIGVFFVGCSVFLLRFKYINYITISDNYVATKRRALSWDEVCITFSWYDVHLSVRASWTYYLFFDDHYLSEEELASKQIKKDAFYLMVTKKRLEIILKKYNKKIRTLHVSPHYKINLYDEILWHNNSIEAEKQNDSSEY